MGSDDGSFMNVLQNPHGNLPQNPRVAITPQDGEGLKKGVIHPHDPLIS